MNLAAGIFEFSFLTEEQEITSSITEHNFPKKYK